MIKFYKREKQRVNKQGSDGRTKFIDEQQHEKSSHMNAKLIFYYVQIAANGPLAVRKKVHDAHGKKFISSAIFTRCNLIASIAIKSTVLFHSFLKWNSAFSTASVIIKTIVFCMQIDQLYEP